MGVLVLCGCAAEKSFQNGKQLLFLGQVEEGLKAIEAAMAEDPQRAEFRSYYLLQRERAISQIVQEGDAARMQGRADAAQAAYKRALLISPAHPRALAGLEIITADLRRTQTLLEAKDLYKKGDQEGATSRLRGILGEDPKQRDAWDLLRMIDEKAYRDGQQSQIKSRIKNPVSLDFREAPLKLVLDTLGRAGGINFVLDRDIKQDVKTTISLKNVRVEDGLRLVMTSNQLEYKILNDNSILVYPNNPQKQRDYRELVVKTFFIANADAKQVLNMLRAVLKTKDAYVDERLNLLVMRDIPEVIRVAEKLIATQDLPEPEVILELEVLEVSQSRLMDLGIQYPTRISAGIAVATSSSGNTASAPGVFTLNDFKNRSPDMVQLTVSNPALALSLSRTDGDTNLLANPRIRVKNKEKAKILIGERLPVITTTSTANVGVSESVSYLDVGMKLEVEPSIFLDDEVAIKVGLEVSSLLEVVQRASGLQTYRVGTRNASTTLRLRDGEPQVLAGLIQNSDRDSANKVPGLGDLPILGRLFASNHTDHQKTEVVLMITPRIVRNLKRPEMMDAEIASGTESSVGGSGLYLPNPADDATRRSSQFEPTISPVQSNSTPTPPLLTPTFAPASQSVNTPLVVPPPRPRSSAEDLFSPPPPPVAPAR